MVRSHRKCQACSILFAVDPRNSERQRFCSNADCQRERRRPEQRVRRATALGRLCAELLNDDPTPVRKLHAASRIPEALIDTQSPILIGLISMLIDSEDRDEISKALRRLWQRGAEILNPPSGEKQANRLPRSPIQKLAATSTAGRCFLNRDFRSIFKRRAQYDSGHCREEHRKNRPEVLAQFISGIPIGRPICHRRRTQKE